MKSKYALPNSKSYVTDYTRLGPKALARIVTVQSQRIEHAIGLLTDNYSREHWDPEVNIQLALEVLSGSVSPQKLDEIESVKDE